MTMKKRFLAMAMVAAMLAASTLTSGQTIEPKGELTYPISARVELPAGAVLKAGVPVTVKVKIRNTVTEAGRHMVAMPLQAVLLRRVRWAGQPVVKGASSAQESKRWLRPVYGSTKKNPDGTVEHHTMAQRLTELAFETGLLLPGEEMTVDMPLRVTGATAELSVTYAVVPGNFESQVLLLAEPISPKGPGKVTVNYLPYSAATARARERVRGVALVKATMEPGAPALAEVERKLEFALPMGH